MKPVDAIFQDRNGAEYLVRMSQDGTAKLFVDGFEVFKGTMSQIEKMGLFLKNSKNSSKVFKKQAEEYSKTVN